jgi:hypothetical protein
MSDCVGFSDCCCFVSGLAYCINSVACASVYLGLCVP